MHKGLTGLRSEVTWIDGTIEDAAFVHKFNDLQMASGFFSWKMMKKKTLTWMIKKN